MRMWILGLMALCVVLVGCGDVPSDHPLSTDADSVVDERLIGWWEPVPKEGEEDEPQKRVLVGRLEDHKNTLEIVAVGLDDEHQIKVERYRLYTVRLDGRWYVSFTDDKEEQFQFVRYEIDDDQISIEILEPGKVAAAIEAKAIEGRVKLNPDSEDPFGRKYDELRLTAKTAELRAWITNFAAAVWLNPDISIRRVPLELPSK